MVTKAILDTAEKEKDSVKMKATGWLSELAAKPEIINTSLEFVAQFWVSAMKKIQLPHC